MQLKEGANQLVQIALSKFTSWDFSSDQQEPLSTLLECAVGEEVEAFHSLMLFKQLCIRVPFSDDNSIVVLNQGSHGTGDNQKHKVIHAIYVASMSFIVSGVRQTLVDCKGIT